MSISDSIAFFHEIFSDQRKHIQFLRFPKEYMDKNGFTSLIPYIQELVDRPVSQQAIRLDTAILRITEHCNLNCLHCSVDASPQRKTRMDRAITLRLLNELVGIGVRVVKFTGGEPLSVPWIVELIKYSVENGVFVEVETSCTTLSKRLISSLDGCKEKIRFAVGFDSLKPEIYEWFRNTQGSYQKVLAGLNLLREHGFMVKIMTVLSRANWEEIPTLMNWTWETFGDKGFHRLLPVLSSFGRGVHANRDTGLTAAELNNYLHEVYFPFFRSHYKPGEPLRMNIGLPIALVPFDLDLYPICGCGTQKIGITPRGQVGLCHLIDGHAFAISGDCSLPLQLHWEAGLPFEYMRGIDRKDIQGICGKCRFFRVCLGGCRIHSRVIAGKEGYSDPTCQAFADAGFFPRESLLE